MQNRNVNQPRQRPAQQVQPAQPVRELAPFMGCNPTRLQNNKVFGPEALKLVQAKFNYLTGNKLVLTPIAPHPHPYGAFSREHFDTAIVSGLATADTIVSVGTENRNQLLQRYFQGVSQNRHTTVHGMAPVMSPQDSFRHREWLHSLRQRDPTIPLNGQYHQVAQNVCATAATEQGLCQCVNANGQRWADISVFKAVDSAYYPGVMSGIMAEMITKPNSPAYLTFGDYHQAIRNEMYEYYTPDNEAFVEITEKDGFYQVSSTVHGNIQSYTHRALNTHPSGSWFYDELGHKFSVQVLDSFDFTGHSYVLAKMMYYGFEVPTPNGKTFTDLFVRASKLSDAQINLNFIYDGVDKVNQLRRVVRTTCERFARFFRPVREVSGTELPSVDDATAHVMNWLIDNVTMNAEGQTLPSYVTLTPKTGLLVVSITVEQEGRFVPKQFTVVPELIPHFVNALAFKHSISEHVVQYRKAMMTELAKKFDNRTNFTTISETLALAHIIAVRLATKQVLLVQNDEVNYLKLAINGQAKPHTRQWQVRWGLANLTTNASRLATVQWRKLVVFFILSFLFSIFLRTVRTVTETPVVAGLLNPAQAFGAIAGPIVDLDWHFYNPQPSFEPQPYVDALEISLSEAYEVNCPFTRRVIMPAAIDRAWALEGYGMEVASEDILILNPHTMYEICLSEVPMYVLIVSNIIFYTGLFTISYWLIFKCKIKKQLCLFFCMLIFFINMQEVAAMDSAQRTNNILRTSIMAIGLATIAKKSIQKGSLYYNRNNGVTKTENPEGRKRRHRTLMRNIANGSFKIFLFVCIFSHCLTPVSAQTQIPTKVFVSFFATILILTLTSLFCVYTLYNKIKERQPRMWIKGSCVFDDNRLDFSSLPSVVKNTIKTKLFHVMDSPQTIRDKVGCKAGDKPYAGQVGPIISGSVLKEPTIKHPCALTNLAALKRGCEGIVEMHPDYITPFEVETIASAKRVVGYIESEGGVYINHVEWLNHHPEAYRIKIMQAYNTQRMEHFKYTYDIFPKVEMQHTTVEPDLKETPANDLKERCIYGPQDIKKLATGPFMHKMEQILHKYCKNYCGMKNWSDIAHTLDEMLDQFALCGYDPICVEADFSRYDSTQRAVQLSGFTRWVEYIINNAPLTFSDVLNPAEIIDYVRQSEELQLVAFHGAVRVRVPSRASGDSWTTLGNSENSRKVWKVVLDKFGFNPKLDGAQPAYVKDRFKPCFMMFKGDDMIGIIHRGDVATFQSAVAAGFNRDNTPTPHGVGNIVKIVEVRPLSECSYLSALFFERRNGTHRMIRKPERVFITNPFSTKIQRGSKNLDREALELLFAKGQSMLAWAEGLPIFDALARKMIALGKPNPFEPEWSDKCRICTDLLPSDYEDCCAWMYNRYGITLTMILEIEDAIRSIRKPLSRIVLPTLDLLGC